MPTSPPYKSTKRSAMPAEAVESDGDGRHLWCRPGVAALMAALIELEVHPFDKQQSNQRFEEAVRETAQYSDTTLSVVAEQIHRGRRQGKLRHRPRLKQLHQMCHAAAPGAARWDAEMAAVF